MTKDEFIKELGQLGYVWQQVGRGNYLRTYIHDQEFCPITAVCYGKTGRVYSPHLCCFAATQIGLSDSLTQLIADAADGCRHTLESITEGEFNALKHELQVATQ